MSILDAATCATYTAPDSSTWTYYQDAETPGIFYVLPVPEIALVNGQPGFHLTIYNDATGFVSASLQLTTTLAAIRPAVLSGIQQELVAKGVASPTPQAMPYVDLGDGDELNRAFLSYASADGSVSRTSSVVPSLSGTETAVFTVGDLSASEVAFLKRYFGGDVTAGTVDLVYELTVTARMAGVTAHVHFSASAAFDFQRTFQWVS